MQSGEIQSILNLLGNNVRFPYLEMVAFIF